MATGNTNVPIFGQDPRHDSSFWSAPGQDAASVTKSDTTILAITNAAGDTTNQPCRALYVGGAGDVAVRLWYSQHVVTFPSVPAGSILPIACDRVMSTNTTATNIVAIF